MSDFKQEKYDLPKDQFIEFDHDEKGTISETELKETESDAPDLLTAPKMEILRYAARKMLQMELVDPDQSCNKCYGLGYTGIEHSTNMPAGCKCVMPTPKNLRRIEKQKLRQSRINKTI